MAFENFAILKPFWWVTSLVGWVDLEHRLWQQLAKAQLSEAKIVVGFSGGADSLSLLWALHRLKLPNLTACHIHHGVSKSPEVDEYRNQAALFCKKFCETHLIPFRFRQNTTAELSSEAALRDFRHEALAEVKTELGADFVALAHHRDDLLETRLLRLIRGTGPQGLMAMEWVQGGLLRPFLGVSKKTLEKYLSHCSLTAFADPSNFHGEPFRNWLRQEWLPSLELRQPGASHSLARSLEVLSESFALSFKNEEKESPFHEVFLEGPALSRLGLLALSNSQQKRVLARFVLLQNKRDFTHGHIDEVLKRLDNAKNELMFKVGGVDWYVNAQQIRITKNETV
jgi:tRNA(Ile)-lysidine synthase